MSINFPTWVTDSTPVPASALVGAKKLIYTFAAVEKLRRLHNAAWMWQRGTQVGDIDPVAGEEFTQEAADLLAQQFPGQWPTPPTEPQVKNYIESTWKPRHIAAQNQRLIVRRAITPAQLAFVDIDGLLSV